MVYEFHFIESNLGFNKKIQLLFHIVFVKTLTLYLVTILFAFQIYPDAFVQICLQLAYMRMHGVPAPTYETATTRQ